MTEPNTTPLRMPPALNMPPAMLASPHNYNSIRYDLAFQDALLRFAEAQTVPCERPTEEPTTLEEAAAQRFTFLALADVIDFYAERLAEARLIEAGLKNECGLTAGSEKSGAG